MALSAEAATASVVFCLTMPTRGGQQMLQISLQARACGQVTGHIIDYRTHRLTSGCSAPGANRFGLARPKDKRAKDFHFDYIFERIGHGVERPRHVIVL